MGFGRRMVRKSVRRTARRTVSKPVRKAVRTATPRPVRQAMHPAYAARNAVTPRPVKRAGYAIHATRHPFFAAWDAIFGGVFRRHKRSGPAPARHPAPPARTAQRQAAPPQHPASRTGVSTPPVAPRPARLRPEPWPANRAFRGPRPDLPERPPQPTTRPSSFGEAELWDRTQHGLGDGTRHGK
jgi:hypothetical protein